MTDGESNVLHCVVLCACERSSKIRDDKIRGREVMLAKARMKAMDRAMRMMVLVICVMAGAAAKKEGGGMFRPSTRQMKKESLRMYMHDALNFTDFIIVRGLPGKDTPVASPFGSLFCLSDPLTDQADQAASQRVGTLTGLSLAASFDGFTFYSQLVADLDVRRYVGTLSFQGLVHSLKPSPFPITGGTGSFRFALGNATMTPVDVATFNITYRFDIDVFWPPYVL